MPRRAATITQSDVARVIRAAKQAGAAELELHDGRIRMRYAKCLKNTGSSGRIAEPAARGRQQQIRFLVVRALGNDVAGMARGCRRVRVKQHGRTYE